MIAGPIVVPDPGHVRRRVIGVDRTLGPLGARRGVLLAKDRILGRRNRRRVEWAPRHGAVESRHVKVGRPVVREPEPAADAFRARARRHFGGNLKVRHLLADAFVLDAEDGEVVHRDLSDVVDVGDRERAARDQVRVDDFRVGVSGLHGVVVSASSKRSLCVSLPKNKATHMVRSSIRAGTGIEFTAGLGGRVAVRRPGVMTLQGRTLSARVLL